MKRAQRVAVVGAAALATSVAVTGPTAAVAAVAAEPGTGVVLMSGSATTPAWVDDGTVDDGTNGPVTIDGSGSSVRVSVFQAPSATIATLATTAGTLPTSGTHSVSAAGPLTLTIDRPGNHCTVTGDVTMRQLVLDAGVPTAFAADWSGDCGTAVGTSGQVRGASSVPWGGLDVNPGKGWAAPFVGEANDPTLFTVTGHGTDVPAIDSVGLTSSAPVGSFVVIHGTDHCSGVGLAHQQSCTVQVAAAPPSRTPSTGTAHLVVTTAGTTSTSVLSYSGPRTSERGQFFPTNVRVMDTRTGLGVRKGAVAGGTSVRLPVAGRNGVPTTGASAAVLNVTVTGATSGSYVTVFPAGTSRPATSNLNFPAAFTGANLVTVPLGANGAVDVDNRFGSAHVIADLVGYYAATPEVPASGGSDFYLVEPERVLDTRRDWDTQLGAGEYIPLPISYGAKDPRIRGFVVTLTAVNATKAGYLAVTSTEPTGPPKTSSVNYGPGTAVSNLVAAKASQAPFEGVTMPTIWISNAGASTDVVVDVVGVYAQGTDDEPGLRFRPLRPTRVLDTRTDLGAATVGTSVTTVVRAPSSVAGRDTWALAGNITGVLPTATTFLSIWDAGPRPVTSSVNLARGVTRANAAWTALSPTNTYSVFNRAGTTETLYDVTGSFEAWPPSPETLAGVPWAPGPGAGLAAGAGSRGAPAKAEAPRVWEGVRPATRILPARP